MDTLSPFLSISLPLLILLPSRSMHLLPLLFLLQPCRRIDFSSQKFLLAHQLPPVFQPRGIERSRIQRRLYGAPRLSFMTAIAKPALRRQRIDVSKNLRNAVFRVPQLHLAQARRVHQQRASWQSEEFARSRSMSAAAIALANRLHFLDRIPQKSVRNRRLPHSG